MESVSLRQGKMRIVSWLGSVFWLLLSSATFGQDVRCDEGVIRLPDRNGTIQICSAMASKVPQLSKQLTELTKILGSQQNQIADLTRLVRGVNGVSRDIGDIRQAKLLENLSQLLSDSQGKSSDEIKKSIENLNSRLNQLQVQLSNTEKNSGNSDLLKNALKGNLGDSIAKLDIEVATSQLDQLNENLKKLQSAVGDVKRDTSEIISSVATIERNQNAQQEEANQRRQRIRNQIFNSVDNLIWPIRPNFRYGSKESLLRHVSFKIEFMDPDLRVAMNGEPIEKRALEWSQAEVMAVLTDSTGIKEVYDLGNLIERRQVSGSHEFNFLVTTKPTQELTVCMSLYDPLKARRVFLSQIFAMRKDSFDYKYEQLAPIKLSDTASVECEYETILKGGAERNLAVKEVESLYVPSVEMVRLAVESYQTRARTLIPQIKTGSTIQILKGSQRQSDKVDPQNPALAKALEKTQTWLAGGAADAVEVALIFQNLRTKPLSQLVLDIYAENCPAKFEKKYMTFKFDRLVRSMEVVALAFRIKVPVECKHWSMDIVDAN